MDKTSPAVGMGFDQSAPLPESTSPINCESSILKRDLDAQIEGSEPSPEPGDDEGHRKAKTGPKGK